MKRGHWSIPASPIILAGWFGSWLGDGIAVGLWPSLHSQVTTKPGLVFFWGVGWAGNDFSHLGLFMLTHEMVRNPGSCRIQKF